MSTQSYETDTKNGGVGRALQANWVPLSMIGIGVAWLAASNSSLVDRTAKDQRAQAAGSKIDKIADEPGVFSKDKAPHGAQLVGPDGKPLGHPGDHGGDDGWVHQATGAARGALGSVRDAGSAVLDRASQYTGYAGDAGDMAKRAGGRLADLLKRDPWLIGVAGLVAGGIAAALLPPTRIERKCFAEARDELWAKASEFGHEAAERVRELADSTSRNART